MAKLCALACLLTAFTGLVAELVSPREGGALAYEKVADEDLRRRLLAIGWEPPRDPELERLSRALTDSHGVELLHAAESFELALPNGTIAGTPAHDSAAARATRLVAREIALLPASFLRAIGLRRVLLCGELTEERLPIPSLPNYRHTLLLDAEASDEYLARLLHHEIFHFADFADDDNVLADPAWDALNEPGFHYGGGGRSMRDPASAAPSEERVGFVTRYATSALEEDKAETFSFLVTSPLGLRRRAAHDQVLANKRQRLLAMLTALSADLDADFWRRLEGQRQR
jgi:hypothetical protein